MENLLANENKQEIKLYDFHCHLQHQDYDIDLEQVIRNSRKLGVSKAVLTGSNLQNNEKALKIAEKHSDFFDVAIGTSPHDSSSMSELTIKQEIEFVIKNIDKVVGIGEIGLDRHQFFNPESWKKQQEVFEKYLQIGEKYGLPAIIHSRKAENEVFDTLKKYPKVKVMLHCFMKPKMTDFAVKKDWMVSLPTLYGKDIKKIIKNTPIENLATETDSPFLWFDPVTKTPVRNQPGNVIQVYKQIQTIKNIDIQKVSDEIEKNYFSLFIAK